MPVNLKGRSFLTLMDFNKEEIRYLLDLSHDLKRKKRLGLYQPTLKGKNILLLFEKTSTRTRCAFEAAALDEGAHVTFLDSASSQMNKKESLEDSARVFGRFYDGIEYRGFSQEVVENLARFSGVPVWNGLTDIDHPTQLLADMMTIEEKLSKPLSQVKVVFVGDVGNNMAYAWAYACAKMGFSLVLLGPKELHMPSDDLDKLKPLLEQSGGSIQVSHDLDEVTGADVVYTDVWVSMGQEAEMAERIKILTKYRVDSELMKKVGNEGAIFMHCLPAYHDFETTTAQKARDELKLDIREVSDEVFRSGASVVFDEAENRLHTIKAVMVATL